MKSGYSWLLFLACLGLSYPSCSAGFDKLEYLSENYAPFNYADPNDGKVQGYAVDLLHRVWEKLEVKPKPIKIYPWARGFSLTIHKNNTVLFSTTRIPSREVHFKWYLFTGSHLT